MASRQEEKARRRKEREEAERKAAASAARTKRLQLAGGGVLVLAAIAAVVLVVAASGGGSGTKQADRTSAATDVKLPPLRNTNLASAAKAAGCTVLNPKIEGREHTTSPVTYKNSNPPASGPHNPIPADDGYYAPGNEPTKEHWVHSLEHGRIEFQYKDPKLENAMESLADEKQNGTPGYHTLVFQNNTNMPYAVAAVAWGHVLGCKTMSNGYYDAARDFRKAYTDKGPEIIP